MRADLFKELFELREGRGLEVITELGVVAGKVPQDLRALEGDLRTIEEHSKGGLGKEREEVRVDT